MKIGICATHLDNFRLPKDLNYIGVDHGVEELLKQDIEPIYAIGDFDSIHDRKQLNNLKTEVLPTRKDVTDTHAAIDYAISLGYDEIDLFGVTGGRLDHFFAAMCLLEKYHDIDIHIIDCQNDICLLEPGEHKVEKKKYKYISFFAIDECVLTLRHTEYELTDYVLRRDDPLCVSNEIKGDYAYIKNNQYLLLIRALDVDII